MNISLSAFAPENLVSRDGFGSPVPRQPAHLYAQAESGAYLRNSSQVPRRRPFISIKPPYAIEQPIMRTEDRLFDRGWARSAMATRKCGNIYFPKYFMAVRPFFTRNFFQELFGLEGYKNLLENFVRCTIRKSRTVSYDPRVFFKKIFLVSMQRMCTLFG